MRTGIFKKCLGLALAVTFPLSVAMADMRGAILRANGVAVLNGAIARGGSAVLAGDVVQTKAGSSASILSSGNTILMYGDSKLKYQGSSVEVESGAAEVTTNSAMPAQVGTVQVLPAEKSSKYELSKKNGKITVASVLGSLRVSHGTESVLLPAGSMATVDEQKDSHIPKPGVENRERAGIKVSKRTALILLFGAAGTAAAVAYLTTDNPNTASPVIP